MSDLKTWKRTKLFDGRQYAWLHAAYKASDGYLIVGVDNHGGLFIKTGEMLSVRRYSYSSHDELYCATETNDGGYILAGMASGDGENDGLLVKTSSDGREVWHRVFTGNATDCGALT